VKVLAMELFEAAKAETVRPSLKPRTLRTEAVLTGGGRQCNSCTRDRTKECPVDPAVERPLAIDEPLPGLEEVKMQEQPIKGTTSSPIPEDDLTPATMGGLLIDEPLPGLEEDVKMQEQSVVNEPTQSKSVSSPFNSQTRNNLISVPQRSRNSNKSAPPWRLDRASASADLFTRTKEIMYGHGIYSTSRI
jgi:hypothetical protein